jgi:two-component system, chemotaxis family, protein-glutamate methylesterase/glutaminase
VVIPMRNDERGACCAVAIGASAGGVQALRTLLAALPADLPAAVLVVLHLDPRTRSVLPAILKAVTPLRVGDVHEDSMVERGTVYVAIPDRHLLVVNGCTRLGESAPVRFARPSVDVLFESVALGWSGAAIGVLLTGTGVDGAAGMSFVKRAGGCTIVQDPHDAEYGGMPQAAIDTGLIDAVLPLAAIAPAIVRAAELVANGRAA